METFKWSILIGGITFFFFGLAKVRKELQLVAGDKLRRALGSVSSNRFKAFSFGALITFLFQSSSATSVVLISLADTGLLNLYQTISILLGADFSTTFVVILLSIKKIAEISLSVLAIGFFLELTSKQKRLKSIGSILLSFGLIFYGMHLMVVAASPLKASPAAAHVFTYLSHNPLASLIVAIILAGAVHSSGMIGITMALAFAGTLDFETSIPLILGANIGTCVPAILASIGSTYEGKRVAAAHTIAKVIGVLLAFPFIKYIANFINFLSSYISSALANVAMTVPAKIALTHIIFNIALIIITLPLISLLVWFVKILIPTPFIKEDNVFRPLYLDKKALETPALAFAQVKREILRIGTIAHQMFDDCLRLFSKGVDINEEIERIQSMDDKIDVLDKAIRFYLSELSAEKFTKEQGETYLKLFTITSDLEEIGDTISKEMVLLAKKKNTDQKLFSEEGWKDLRDFQHTVGENFNLAISILTQPAEELSAKIERHEDHIEEVEQQLRQSHLNRLHHGLKESFDTSSIHLDILGNLRRINAKLARIASLCMS